jgi:uncharacterized membrane protein HdeD (DUF308 family)
MRKVIKRYIESHWWAFFIKSLVAVVVGLFALFTPISTLAVLTAVVALALIVMGAIEFLRTLASIGKQRDWILSLIIALVEVAVGVFLLINREARFELLAIVVASYIIVRGLFDVVVGLASLKDSTDRFIWTVAGIAGVVLGIIILNYPGQSEIAFVWIFGVYTLIFGLTGLIYSIHARALTHQLASSKNSDKQKAEKTKAAKTKVKAKAKVKNIVKNTTKKKA